MAPPNETKSSVVWVIMLEIKDWNDCEHMLAGPVVRNLYYIYSTIIRS